MADLFTFSDLKNPKAVAFALDGESLAIALGGSVQVHEVQPLLQGKAPRRSAPSLVMPISKAETGSLAWSPNCRTLAVSSGKELAFFDVSAGSMPLGAPLASKGHIRAMKFDKFGAKLFTGGAESLIRVWDVEKATLSSLLKSEIAQVFDVEMLVENEILLSVGNDRRALLYDLRVGKTQTAFTSLRNENYLCISAAGSLKSFNYKTLLTSTSSRQISLSDRLAYLGTSDGVVECWDLRATSRSVTAAKVLTSEVKNIQLDPSGNYLAVGGFGKQLTLVNASNLTPKEVLNIHSERTLDVDWHPFFPILASCSADKTVRLSQSTIMDFNRHVNPS